jgi:hypothetical protein
MVWNLSMKSFILSLALLITGYSNSFADGYFQDTLLKHKHRIVLRDTTGVDKVVVVFLKLV